MDRSAYLSELHSRFALPDPVIAEFVRRVTGCAVTSLHRLVRGDEYEVHRVDIAEGTLYARICQPDTPPQKAEQEAWAMERARQAGVPVPEVLAVEVIGDAGREAMLVAEAAGHQLSGLALAPAQRTLAMTDLGRVLRRLHSVRTPGSGVPDQAGTWRDPAEHRQEYVAKVVADCRHLPDVGVTAAEIDRVIAILRSATDLPVGDDTVLCHADVSAEHVFVDADLRVCGLIDWGLWTGGSAVGDLAAVSTRVEAADFAAVVAGYGESLDDPPFRQAFFRNMLAQATAGVAWRTLAGDTAGIDGDVAALRRALAEL